MKYKSIIAFIALFIAVQTNAQKGPNSTDSNIDTKGIIKGKVVEKGSKSPMEYCSIAIYRLQDSTLQTGTVSNTSGDFILDDIPFGKYFIEIHFVGYTKSTISPVMITPKENKIDLGQTFLSVNTKSLMEVEVVADQRRVEYRLDKKVVNVSEDLNSAGGTAVDVLENTPSVSVDIEGNVTLRGSGSFTVLINGKPTVLDASDALRQIPASNIQNIEIITNPSVKYDPDGNSGIVNVVLKKQIEKGTTGIINASLGLNHKYKFDALLNRRVGKINYFIGGGYDDNLYEGNLQRTHVSYDSLGNSSFNEADGNFDFIRGGAQIKGGLDYDFSPKSNIALELSGGQYKFGMDRSNNSHEYTLPETDDLYFVNTNLSNRLGTYYSTNINYTQIFDSSEHKLQIMANMQRKQGDELEDLAYFAADENFVMLSDVIPFETRNTSVGDGLEYRFQVDYSKPVWNGKIDAGYQARIDSNLDDYVFEEKDPDTGWNSIEEMSSEISFFRNIQSAYLQYGGQFNKIQIQAGLRGEYTNREIEYENFETSYSINRFDYYPSLHLARQFENDMQLMMSYSKRVDRPRSHHLDSIPTYLDQNTIRIGNPALEPEYIHSYELGYQKGWGKNFLAVEAYYRNTTNLITRSTQYDEENNIYYQRMVNINEDHVVGSEVMINWEFAKWLKVNASTDVYYYRIMGDLYGESIDNSNLSWRANANSTFTITPLTRLQLTTGYRGPSVTAQGSAEGMFYTNLALRQDLLKRKLSATLQVRDLFGTMKRDFTTGDTNFEQHIVMQREPRVIMLSLSYKINNYRIEPGKNSDQGSDGGEMDGGF